LSNWLRHYICEKKEKLAGVQWIICSALRRGNATKSPLIR
jgi:hypothetical protein